LRCVVNVKKYTSDSDKTVREKYCKYIATPVLIAHCYDKILDILDKSFKVI
jgi:hypothetical protein